MGEEFSETGDGIFSKWEQLAENIYLSDEWIHRKVETFNFDTNLGTTKLSSSYDVLIPPTFVEYGWIPVTNFDKINIKDLDIRDGFGGAMSTLTHKDNVQVGMNILKSGCPSDNSINERANELDTIEELNFPDLSIDDLINKIVTFDELEFLEPAEIDIRLEKNKLLDDYLKRLAPATKENKKELYRFLSALFIDAYVVWVQPTKNFVASERTIIKISHAIDLGVSYPNFFLLKLYEPNEIRINTRMCSSYHLQVKVPMGLFVTDLKIVSREESDEEVWTEDAFDPLLPAEIAHVKILGKNTNPDHFMKCSILSIRNGFARFVLWVSLSVCAFFLLGLVNHRSFKHPYSSLVVYNPNSVGTTILLITPAALMVFLAARPEHRLILSRMHVGRYSLYMSSGLLLVAAILLSGSLNYSNLDEKRGIAVVWAVCLGVSVWSALSTIWWFKFFTKKD